MLAHRGDYNIVSDGIATGAIQVPGSGQPILLLADHQTTGGYPKIATVISADLPLVGRRRPGSRIRFAAVDVAEAERLRRTQRAALDALIASAVPARPTTGLDLDRLHQANLISGVVFDS
jgi:allophanate hydrolase subunit 2